MLAEGRGYTVLFVLLIALGIGANREIFRAAQGYLPRPFSGKNFSRIVTLWQFKPGLRVNVSPSNFSDWRAETRTLEDMSAFYSTGMDFFEEGRPRRIRVALVSSSLLRMLRVQPALGRDFLPEEENSGKDHAVLLTDALWHSHFHADPKVLGKMLYLNGRSYRVIGVLPRDVGFEPLAETELWAPLAFDSQDLASRGSKWIHVVARLRPRVSLEKARVDMDSISARLEKLYPAENSGWRVDVSPLLQDPAGTNYGATKPVAEKPEEDATIERTALPPRERHTLQVRGISGSLVQVIPLPSIAQREFSPKDCELSSPATVVKRAIDQGLLRGENSVGKHLILGMCRDSIKVFEGADRVNSYPRQPARRCPRVKPEKARSGVEG
ncbi:MAG: ABC transporter permease [Candidatus Acidiferrales bacterium]